MVNLDWGNLPFGYQKTDYNFRCYYRDGKWGEIETSSSEYFSIHIAATALHYGQEAFEGLKAYRGKDGKVRLFRWEENCKRMERSAEGTKMAVVPKNIFYEMILKAVKMNARFIPPYGTGAALYLRPFLFGSGAEVGVKPAKEYLFMVFATPVGPYFKGGMTPVKIAIVRDSDRAAPLGTGSIKVGGNYASSLKGIVKCHEMGYSSPMYLDSKEKKYIDEIGAANFFGVKNNTYITPKSDSILPSITNMSLLQLAEQLGLKVERRPVALEEIESFEEVGACGTAAVISPIGEIKDLDTGTSYYFCKDGNPGPVSKKLYDTLVGIQHGEVEDTFGWTEIIDL
ncbi:MAG: branched chain amino acid aminotransferase [Bacteroidetes bacterium RIFOXYA12_FULL_35_11]|nr:MAG: branched chain amino acid aminotransferase [Bacteroidetes bacterium GWF2_35_48]OFY75748.1 MAG: branched chain amino acid aminotransferase [Bacteroidetes bacterium RIFOXYA12_FULL_35_11]OFY97584.1 MAG: branched chain amino acid aminotransferase [Bacteroidetes bacterium RIFOXYB2_FULL_35_7]OFZ00375.1 MAG: branched chain amino acid aminotransferase [Bacteroidetes bacterium RIFOXYC12_FULL_35_7]HBX51501.1 branched chain amino acid aminotransferase [Bacteroidales bacterium]